MCGRTMSTRSCGTYDLPTMEQPFAPFMCHATPDHFATAGLFVTVIVGQTILVSPKHIHSTLSALRLAEIAQPVPPSSVSLWSSGNEVADHGQEILMSRVMKRGT